MSRRVSILIPAYNARAWIADAIESALAQTWSDKELVIVDDGSTDETFAVANRYASSLVKVIRQDNQGAAAARNTALSACTGAYIQWLDADDLLERDKVAIQMELVRQHSDPRTLFSCGWAHFMYRRAAARFSPGPLWCDLQPLDWILRKWTHNAHMSLSTWLVSRELTDTAGPWDTRLSLDDDGEYFTRVVLASRGIRFAADAAVLYRAVGSSRLSHAGKSDHKLDSQFRSMDLQIARVLALEDSARTRKAILQYLQTWLPLFYPERPDIVERLHALAASVGGRLWPAKISWKYAAIDRIWGRRAAKNVQQHYNDKKQSLIRAYDKLLFHLETSTSARVNRTKQHPEAQT
jgi:glycosyltransferase involved in cell wall biosynthesis